MTNPFGRLNEPGTIAWERTKREIAEAKLEALKLFVRHTDLCQAKRIGGTDNWGSFMRGCTCGLSDIYPEEPAAPPKRPWYLGHTKCSVNR